jgi:adenine C2-methylase RlmN of 23S rRNA A2503 and tRNA A37
VAQARDDIVALARRYSEDGSVDEATEATFRSQQRITFRIRLTGVHDHLED